MRTLLIALTLALLATPVALAQENTEKNETSERPDDAAWTEDCPPDMMCAAGGDDPQPYGDEGCIECSGPVDGGDNATYGGDCGDASADASSSSQAADGGEVCAYDGEERPQQLGPDGCIDCMGPVDDGSTCMDGQQAGETCRDDVYYMDGPTRGPADGSCENCRGDEATPPLDTASEEKSNVPAPAVALAILALAGVALLALPGRK